MGELALQHASLLTNESTGICDAIPKGRMKLLAFKVHTWFRIVMFHTFAFTSETWNTGLFSHGICCT
jgi:hypothetical protein